MEAFSHDTLVLTPNRRLANYLLSQSESLTKPNILDWQSWIKWLWEQAEETSRLPLPLLITPQAATFLWHQIVNPESVASTAEQAWSLLQQWCEKSIAIDALRTEEHHAFWQWQNDYRQQLGAQNHIDLQQLGNALIPQLEQLAKHIPAKIFLVHFSEFTPQQRTFIQSLKALNREICIVQPSGTTKSSSLVTADSPEHETALMVSWIKAHINDEASITCVCPDLTAMRSALERQFSFYFPDQFEISASPALAEYPIISSAFSLFALANETLPIEQFSHVLRSPFIGFSNAESHARHKFDAQCREFQAHTWQRSALMALTQQAEIPYFSRLLSEAGPLLSLHWILSPSIWAQRFSHYLSSFQWPGEKSLSSLEYQCLQRWRLLLSEFASLDQVCPHGLTFQQATHWLHHFARQTDFQPQSQRKKLQILGILEAAGIPTSTLWLQGFTDETWPPASHPNPFIPLELQRQTGMPHASPEREYRYALGIQQQYQACSETLIASYAKADSGRTLSPSPLISGFKPLEITKASVDLPANALHYTQKIELYTDTQVTLQANAEMRGGSLALKMQSACPFQAFAHLRLKASSLAQATLGLTPLERGILIHHILESVWKTLGSQSTLLAMSHEDLSALLRNNIHRALQSIPSGTHNRIHATVIALEQERLQQLLTQWLEIEKQRPPFTIHSLEAKHTLTLAGTSLQVRIDRIDKTENGEYVIVDYKTSQIDPRNCLGERPLEPQLPLYTLLSPKITGLAFAQIRTQHSAWKPLQHPDIPWDSLRADWEKNLSQLLTEFQSGLAQVAPQSPSICQICPMGSLCRIKNLT